MVIIILHYLIELANLTVLQVPRGVHTYTATHHTATGLCLHLICVLVCAIFSIFKEQDFESKQLEYRLRGFIMVFFLVGSRSTCVHWVAEDFHGGLVPIFWSPT